jgi:3'-phosphoadenosine 5'-phosphosulfate (PAPS) 3'-phosphatase
MDGTTTTTLRKSLLEDKPLLQDEEIPLEDLALFVDPLDGTREFVEGRLQNVACLIGIARKNRPIAGVVCLPFPEGSTESDPRVHYAIADQPNSAGTWPVQEVPNDATEESSTGFTILTGDSNNPVLVNATACAKSIAKDQNHHVIVGGTAAKLRWVATEPNCLAILHFKTELWDTCAPEPLIASKGGKITDLFGSPLVHAPDRPFGNIFGVVASSKEAAQLHDELCANMRADTESVHKIFGTWMGNAVPTTPQAMDVARDLNGIPFTVEELQKEVLGDEEGQGASLKSYSVPESGAWRGMMSNGGRFLLDWEKDASYSRDLPSSVFYKRIVMADLAHARDKLTSAPHKLVRDVKSYQVETSFLTSRACQEGLIKEAGLRINKVFGSDLRPVAEELGPKEQLESRFSVLLEDFDSNDGWEQQWLLDEEATKAALGSFARMHAYFWTGSDFWKREGGKLGEELEQSVWSNGGYMQPRLQGFDQLEQVAKGWAQRYPTFSDALAEIPELQGAELGSLGERLEKIASAVGEKSHPFGHGEGESEQFKNYRILIHGNPKQANIFFRRRMR